MLYVYTRNLEPRHWQVLSLLYPKHTLNSKHAKPVLKLDSTPLLGVILMFRQDIFFLKVERCLLQVWFQARSGMIVQLGCPVIGAHFSCLEWGPDGLKQSFQLHFHYSYRIPLEPLKKGTYKHFATSLKLTSPCMPTLGHLLWGVVSEYGGHMGFWA